MSEQDEVQWTRREEVAVTCPLALSNHLNEAESRPRLLSAADRLYVETLHAPDASGLVFASLHSCAAVANHSCIHIYARLLGDVVTCRRAS